MKVGEIGQILRHTNLWWRSPRGWQREDPDLRALAESSIAYEPDPLRGLKEGGLYLLRGPRRVGKSVELKRAIASLLQRNVEPRAIIHASVDGWRDADLGGLVDVGRRVETRAVTAGRYWFIDEITSVVGDWPSRTKWLRDNDAGFARDTVVLTGSSARGLDAAVKALAGRRGRASHTDRTLLPMGFAPFCRALGLDEVPFPDPLRVTDLRGRRSARAIVRLQPWLNDLVTAWEMYVLTGGFPRAVDERVREHDVSDAFRESLWSVIHGEAMRSFRFSATQTIGLLARLSSSLAGPLNVAHLSRETGVAESMAAARLNDLREAYIVWPCHAEQDLAPHLRSQSKFYFTDPLFARLAAWRGAHPEPDVTVLSEQQLGLALWRHFERLEPGSFGASDQVLFHRSATRAEIDFVGPAFGDVAIESRYVDGSWARAAQTLRASRWRGIVATRSVLDLDGDVWAVPAPVLALLIDD